MADSMPVVNAEFGASPVIEFPSDEAPKGLKVVELVEGDGPMVRRGDTVTVNYHGVVWGGTDPFDSSFVRHQPASFGIGVGQVIKGWDQTVPGHNVGSRRSTATVPVACRRPASAAAIHWCSSSTSSRPADGYSRKGKAPASIGALS